MAPEPSECSESRTGQVTEVEMLKEPSHTKLLEMLRISRHRERKCWHALGRVVRQSLLEAMGERWGGGAVSIPGFGCWWGLRESENAPPKMGFTFNKSLAASLGLPSDPPSALPPPKELDFTRVAAVCGVDPVKLSPLFHALFTTLAACVTPGQRRAEILLPHVGTFCSGGSHGFRFRCIPELLEVVEPAPQPALHPPAHHGESKLRASIYQWLRSAPSTSACGSVVSGVGVGIPQRPSTAVASTAMATAMQRHQENLRKREEENRKLGEYVLSKARESERHEKAAAKLRQDLVRSTSAALSAQVGEQRGKQGEPSFHRQNIIPSVNTSPSCPMVPQEPPGLPRSAKAEVQRMLCRELDKQVAERSRMARDARMAEKQVEAKMVADTLKALQHDTRAARAQKQEAARSLAKAWQQQIAMCPDKHSYYYTTDKP